MKAVGKNEQNDGFVQNSAKMLIIFDSAKFRSCYLYI